MDASSLCVDMQSSPPLVAHPIVPSVYSRMVPSLTWGLRHSRTVAYLNHKGKGMTLLISPIYSTLTTFLGPHPREKEDSSISVTFYPQRCGVGECCPSPAHYCGVPVPSIWESLRNWLEASLLCNPCQIQPCQVQTSALSGAFSVLYLRSWW